MVDSEGWSRMTKRMIERTFEPSEKVQVDVLAPSAISSHGSLRLLDLEF